MLSFFLFLLPFLFLYLFPSPLLVASSLLCLYFIIIFHRMMRVQGCTRECRRMVIFRRSGTLLSQRQVFLVASWILVMFRRHPAKSGCHSNVDEQWQHQVCHSSRWTGQSQQKTSTSKMLESLMSQESSVLFLLPWHRSR